MSSDLETLEDDVDLQEEAAEPVSFARSLWNSKWLMLAFTFIGACVAGGIHTLMPAKKVASLTFEPVSELVTAPYTRLKTEFPNAGHTPTPESLFERFTNELRRFDTVDYAARTSGILSGESESLTSETFHTEHFSWNANHKVPDNPETKLISFKVHALGDYPAVLEHFFKLLISKATENTRRAIESHYLAAVDNIEAQQKEQIADIKQQMDSIRRSYSDQKEHRLAILKEQAAIARNAGISKPISGSDAGLYSRGYLALEKEIELLSKRTSDDAYIPELVDLSRRLAQIEGDSEVEQLKATLKTSAIAKDQFKAAQYDQRTLVMKDSGWPMPLMLGAGSVCGLMLGLLIALIIARSSTR